MAGEETAAPGEVTPGTRREGAPAAGDADPVAAAARGYERAAGDAQRARGGFATPAPIARALVAWAVRDAGARVLDPAVGGGVFALAAVERLRALAPGTPPGGVLGVDVDADALALAEPFLGDEPAVGTREGSFFAFDPADAGRFDAVVGNPPFVRQEALDKGHVRAHLATFGPDGATPYLDGDRAIDRRSDAYVYFLTNATRFLRPGGRLGMVVPTKWLATRYGESLQRFLQDHYRVRAVVGFSARAFDDALVDAALVCLRRRDGAAGAAPTADGRVRFVRVTGELSPAALAAAIDGRGGAEGRGEAERRYGTEGRGEAEGRGGADGRPAGGDRTAGGTAAGGDSHRTVAVPQARLRARGPGKLAHYLEAPPGAVELLDRGRDGGGLVPLGELAAVAYGHKTGANDFFFLDPEDPVADRFRSPAVASFRGIDGPVLEAGEVPAAVLDVHDYVREVAPRGDAPADPAAAVLEAMEADGYGDTAAYVRAGAREGYAGRATCAARRVWFDLGPLSAPAVLHPKFFDERVRVVHNRAGAVPSNAIDCLELEGEVPVEPLLGALNCSLYRLALECWGRTEGGGALQLMTYELEGVPAPDVRAFGPADRERVAAAVRALADGEDAARRLDAAVLDAVGLDEPPERVAALREELVRRRVDGAEAGVQVG